MKIENVLNDEFVQCCLVVWFYIVILVSFLVLGLYGLGWTDIEFVWSNTIPGTIILILFAWGALLVTRVAEVYGVA